MEPISDRICTISVLNGEIGEMLAAANLKPHEGGVFWEPKTDDFGGEKRAENAAENRRGGT